MANFQVLIKKKILKAMRSVPPSYKIVLQYSGMIYLKKGHFKLIGLTIVH